MIRKMNKILIAIGSNHDAERHLEEVRILLKDSFGDDIVFSPTLQTADVKKEGPDFINALAVITTNMSYQEVKALLKKLEEKCGNTKEARKRHEVAMDLDILAFNNRRYHLNDWNRSYIQELIKHLENNMTQ